MNIAHLDGILRLLVQARFNGLPERFNDLIQAARAVLSACARREGWPPSVISAGSFHGTPERAVALAAKELTEEATR